MHHRHHLHHPKARDASLLKVQRITVAIFAGGLALTGVLYRTSANAFSGARSTPTDPTTLDTTLATGAPPTSLVTEPVVSTVTRITSAPVTITAAPVPVTTRPRTTTAPRKKRQKVSSGGS